MDIREVLALNLRRHREKQGLSQREVADGAQITRTYVSGIERSHHAAGIDVVGRLAQVLGLNPNELLIHPALQQAPDPRTKVIFPFAPEGHNVVEIPISIMPTYECGAFLLSFFGYPEMSSRAYWRRIRIEPAICNMVLQRQARRDPAWAESTQTVRPSNLLPSERDATRCVRAFYKQVERRFAVARVIGDIIGDDPETSWMKQVPEGGHPFVSEKVAELIAPFVGDKEIVNILSRVLAPSFPVVHVALALKWLHLYGFGCFENASIVEEVCLNRQALLFTLQTAETFRSWVSSALQRRRNVASLIQFKPT